MPRSSPVTPTRKLISSASKQSTKANTMYSKGHTYRNAGIRKGVIVSPISDYVPRRR